MAAAALLALLSGSAGASDARCEGRDRLPERFIGTWEEYELVDGVEQLAGTLVARYEEDGCLFSQRFRSAEGGFSFISRGRFDEGQGAWVEHFVLSNGAAATYRWLSTGDDVVFERIAGGDGKAKRLRATRIEADSFDVVDERSDDGATWRQISVTPTRRVSEPGFEPTVTLPFCTPHGRFDIRFDALEVSVSYSIGPQATGTVEGSLSGSTIAGQWVEDDYAGDIVIQLGADWTTFSAVFHADDPTLRFYRNWPGALRPTDAGPSFDLAGVTYRCD